MIIIEPSAKAMMIEDARTIYPDECCGFMFGEEDTNENRTIREIIVVNNAKEGDKRKRFEIAPQDYLKAEEYALENNLQLLGVYHSHPNNPAIPSEHDRVAAQPYFSYIIISVKDNRDFSFRSWRLNDDFQFEEEVINNYQYSNI